MASLFNHEAEISILLNKLSNKVHQVHGYK